MTAGNRDTDGFENLRVVECIAMQAAMILPRRITNMFSI